MVPLLLLALLPALAGRPFPEERLLLDRRLETLRRILPDGPNPPADRALVMEMAQSTGLESLEVQPRPPFDSRSPWADVVVDLSGVGSYDEVDRFFRQAALSPRLLDVESVALTPAPGDAVRLTTVVRLPYRPEAAPLPAPPEGLRAQLAGVPKPQADAFLRDQALVLAKADAIDTLRRNRRNPRLFLSEAAAVTRGRPLVLNQATVGDEFFLRGFAVGQATLKAFESRLERGFFRVSQVLLARQGPCYRFEVRGRSPVVGLDAEIPLPTSQPFSMEQCRSDRDPPGTSVLRSPAPRRPPPRNRLDLRLRDVDWADVFGVLYQLTGEAFLVDADVAGRVSIDFPGVELEEALGLLQKAGLKVSPGPLRRVSRQRAAPARPAPSADAPRISLAVKRAELRDVLAALAEADPSLAASPRDLPGRISVWAREFPAADLRAALVEAAGPAAGADTTPAAPPAPPRRLELRPEELAVEEVELAGLVASDGRWMALVYSPAGTLYTYRVGDKLADGTIGAVESTDVLLQTEEGPVRVVLPLPGR